MKESLNPPGELFQKTPNAEKINKSSIINKTRRNIYAVVIIFAETLGMGGCATPRTTIISEDNPPIVINPETGQSLTPDLTEKDVRDSNLMAKLFCPPDQKGSMFYTDDGVDAPGGLRTKKLSVFCRPSDKIYKERDNKIQREKNKERILGNSFNKGSLPIKKGPVEKDPVESATIAPQNYVEEIYSSGGQGGYGTLEETVKNAVPAFIGGGFYALGQLLRRPDETNIVQEGGGADVSNSQEGERGGGHAVTVEQRQNQAQEQLQNQENRNQFRNTPENRVRSHKRERERILPPKYPRGSHDRD